MNYYCHKCNQRVTVNEALCCNNCHDEFVEEIGQNDNSVFLDETPESNPSLANENSATGNTSDNSSFYYVRDSRPDGGRTFVFEGSNPIMGLMSPGSPFSTLFEHAFSRQRYPRSQESSSSVSTAQENRSSNLTSTQPVLNLSRTSNTSGNGSNIGNTGNSINNSGSSGSNTNFHRNIYLGGDNLMSFFNQLITNLAEGREGGSGGTRVTFHIDDSGSGFQQFHGNINDYAWGEGGIDYIVTHLLNQFDSGRTENVSDEDLMRLPITKVDSKQVENGKQCTTCMETFVLDEEVAQLNCEHIFHQDCIVPWLKKNNTCPICRKIVDPKTWGPKITDVDELD